MTPLLHIEALSVRFGPVPALDGVTLTLERGETLALVGESGSGKTVTALAAMRLLGPAARVTGGRVLLDGRDLAQVPPSELRRLRGPVMAMAFQDARAALNPIRSVGRQVADALRAHGRGGPDGGEAEALALLRAVRMPEPERLRHALPAELSGGMCQRAMIALAIACRPALLIADEPTTGLDAGTRRAVMELLAGLVRARGMALVLVTHDLGLAARHCGRVAVMERGRMVEEGPAAAVLAHPAHPCTRRLVAASPTRRSTLADLAPGHGPAWPRAADGAAGVEGAARADGVAGAEGAAGPRAGTGPLLAVTGAVRAFGGVRAVDGVSFALAAGGSLGLVGESGSGKSTLVRLVGRLLDLQAGEVVLDGCAIGAVPARAFHRSALRRAIGVVFQDAPGSLDPRRPAWACIAHPLRRLEGLRGAVLAARVREAAAAAGLPEALLGRRAHELSGGQAARVGIARAVACRPRLLVLDEPTASLDAAVQAGVLRRLDGLRREAGMALLLVSHDLNVVRMMCDELVVLRAGRVVEAGPAARVLAQPRAAYTRTLVEAAAFLDARA